MEFLELTNEQRRQLIDAQQLYASWRPASAELERMGSLIWQTSKGRRYLTEQHGRVRKSLGRETPELRAKKDAHDQKRKALTTKVKGLKKRLDQMAPVNRALKLGRMPTIAANILRELDRENLLGSHIIVAGTNALYAYEGATGTLLDSQHVATTDADLLWDSNQSLLLAATGVPREGLLGILRRADKTFKSDYGLNPTNDDGYIVDLLCAETDNFQTMKVDADVEATKMPGVQWLLSSPQLEAIVIAEDGYPVRVVVPDPRTFALHKLWVSRRPDRQTLKRPRDATHAEVVAELAKRYLQQPLVIKEMVGLPKELKALVKDLKQVK
ncbi:MAG: nucleotidyltransferase domain-containing protein [Gammaproteobacteria bacterium]